MLRTLWKWLAAGFSVVVILLAIGIGLFRLLLPFVPQYHERIEAFASEAAGTPVLIEGIDARWGLAGPELRFRNAQLLTADSSEVLLSAQRGSVVLDFGALFRKRQLQAGQIVLDGLRLEVVRDAGNQWQIGGRTLRTGSGNAPRRLSVGLREAEVVFRDELSGAGPWRFEDVDLNVELANERLRIDGLLNLPADLGGEIEASLEADGDLASPETLKWQLYVSGQDLLFDGWNVLLPVDKPSPVTGNGDTVIWLALEGRHLQQASLQFDLRDLALAKNNQLVRQYDVARGRIEFDRVESGWRASGRDIVMASDGIAWPTATFAIEQVGADGAAGLLYADADYLRLEDVVSLADWLPDVALRERIADLQPRGIVEDLSFRMTRDADRVDNYSLRTGFAGLGMNATGGMPGFDGLRGDLRMDAFGGRLQLNPGDVVIDLPEVFGKPVSAQRLNGIVVWRQSGGGWRIVSDNIDLDHAVFRSSTSFEVTLPPAGNAPLLDLHAYLSDVDVAGLRTLIPDPILKPGVRGWLNDALVGGTVPVANVTWSGALDSFPFDAGDGEFRAIAELNDVELAYAKNWPVAREIDGTLSFHNASFAAGLNSGELAGNRISVASISMADLRAGELQLKVTADGMLDRLHGFLLATPLIKDEDNPLRTAEFSGPGTAEVDIRMPLKRKIDADVAVSVSTVAGEVALPGLAHRLEQVEGSLGFRNGDISAERITALVLGAPVVIDVAPQILDTDEGPRRATVATGRGVVTDRQLMRLHDSLPSMVSGSAAYTATVTFPEKAAAMPVSVAISSSLEGMAVTLPEPVAKSAGTPRNFALTLFLPRGGVQTDAVYGDVGNARINWLRDGPNTWKLDRGGIHFGATTATLPESSGLAITGAAGRVDVGGWLGLNDGQQSSQPAPVVSVRLDARELDAYGQIIAGASVTVDRSEREWLVQVDSPTVAGGLFVPFAGDSQPIIANMERLYIDTANGSDDARATAGELNPGKVPEVDLQADDFRLGDMKLGEVRARLRKTAGGVAMEDFVSEAAAFAVTGGGSWRLDRERHSSRLDLKLVSTDLAPTLTALGFDESIDASNAEIDFALNWPGPPGPQFKSELDGTVKVRVGAGQLQTVQPGAGRVFGLLSFTALPRRLSLDFRDVFDKGFGFDYIEGDFTLDNGDAFTSNLVLEGPAAQVGIAGRAGLVARDYDQTAVVYGNFGAALPVAGVIAGGPVIGGAMLIFSELFKKPLQDMARVNYRITGSWDEPEIERVLAAAGGAGASR